MEDKLKKLEPLDRNKSLEMIYMWVKQGSIQLSQFKVLITLISDKT